MSVLKLMEVRQTMDVADDPTGKETSARETCRGDDMEPGEVPKVEKGKPMTDIIWTGMENEVPGGISSSTETTSNAATIGGSGLDGLAEISSIPTESKQEHLDPTGQLGEVSKQGNSWQHTADMDGFLKMTCQTNDVTDTNEPDNSLINLCVGKQPPNIADDVRVTGDVPKVEMGKPLVGIENEDVGSDKTTTKTIAVTFGGSELDSLAGTSSAPSTTKQTHLDDTGQLAKMSTQGCSLQQTPDMNSLFNESDVSKEPSNVPDDVLQLHKDHQQSSETYNMNTEFLTLLWAEIDYVNEQMAIEANDVMDEYEKSHQMNVELGEASNVRHKIQSNSKKKKSGKKHVDDSSVCEECGYRARAGYLTAHMRIHTGEKPFACDVCDFKCNRKFILRTHKMALHSNKRSYACEECDFRGKTYSNLYRHKRTHVTEKPYSCTLCDYTASHEDYLKKHMKVHTDDKPHKCDMCDYKSREKVGLKKHINKRHLGVIPDKPFACNVCDLRVENKNILIVHLRTHTGEKPYKCTICDYKCCQSGTLYKHMGVHSSNRPFSCELCGKKFRLKKYVESHMKTHTIERPFPCKLCEYKAKDPYILQKHQDVHSGPCEKRFTCDQCDFKFKDLRALKSHEKVHSGLRPFSCTLCDYTSRTASLMESHMTTHTRIKPFACDQCEYRCSRRNLLSYHKMTHTDHKPHACDMCDYRCRLLPTLRTHKKIVHSNKRPFSCDECNFKCKSLQTLRSHKMRHTGEKPFACDLCNYKFSRSYLLKTHRMAHTGERPNKCDSCDFAATTLPALNIHIVKVHQGKPYACSRCDFTSSKHSSLLEHKKIHVYGAEPGEICDVL